MNFENIFSFLLIRIIHSVNMAETVDSQYFYIVVGT